MALEFGADIHDVQSMKPNDFGGPLTFHLVPPGGKRFHKFVKYIKIYEINWHNIYSCSLQKSGDPQTLKSPPSKGAKFEFVQ